jgi:hypothetical protein
MVGVRLTTGMHFLRYLRDLAKTRYDVPYRSSFDASSGFRTSNGSRQLEIEPIALDERLVSCRVQR